MNFWNPVGRKQIATMTYPMPKNQMKNGSEFRMRKLWNGEDSLLPWILIVYINHIHFRKKTSVMDASTEHNSDSAIRSDESMSEGDLPHVEARYSRCSSEDSIVAPAKPKAKIPRTRKKAQVSEGGNATLTKKKLEKWVDNILVCLYIGKRICRMFMWYIAV